MTTWKLYFDGACPNGVPNFGWILEDEAGKDVAKGGGDVDLLGANQTTNVAEYGGLIHGIVGSEPYLKQGDILEIYGDSQLVVRQVKGEYRVKKLHLVPYVRKVRDLVDLVKAKGVTVYLEWVPREQNTKADKLSKGGATPKPKSDWKEIQEDVPPSIGRV